MTRSNLKPVPHDHVIRIGEAIARRADRHMPGNPFPPDSPWGRELDQRYAEDRAAERWFRHREAAAVREARRAVRPAR